MQTTPLSDDPSALAWVVDEVKQSLEQAHKLLRKALKSAAHTEFSLHETVDLQSLRSAQDHIHKAVGALELAALPEGAQVLRASETALARWLLKPHELNESGAKAIEALSFALLDFVRRRIAGREVSAMALYPQYEAIAAVAGLEAPRPADLWEFAQTVSFDRPLGVAAADVEPVRPDTEALGRFEAGLLLLMRQGELTHAADLSSLMASLSIEARERADYRATNTWALASGVLTALADGRLAPNLPVKRVLSALMGQLRATVKQQATPSERLAKDLLLFCAQAQPAAGTAPSGSVTRHHVGLAPEVLRQHFHAPELDAASLTTPSLGLVDPAWVTQALKRVALAKDAWSAVSGGDLMRLATLHDVFMPVGDSLRRLYSHGNQLALALTEAATDTVQSNKPPAAALAMEVATALLYLEASLQDEETGHPLEYVHLQRLAERIDNVREGHEPEPLDDWIDTLYRRVADDQTMGSVVKELRVNLAESEKLIDQFFRDASQRPVLLDVPRHLQSMKGVFSVLGMTEADRAVMAMRQDVDVLLKDSDEPQALLSSQERLSHNVGAMGFLLDLMGVQAPAAKQMFAFDAATGLLSSRLTHAAGQAVRHVPELSAQDSQPAALVSAQQLAAPVADADVDMDEDMQGVFIEEAQPHGICDRRGRAGHDRAARDGARSLACVASDP